MNAPLRSDAVSLPLTAAVATFRVRQRTAGTWDVVREISGPDVLSVEESPLRIGDLHRDPADANAAAAAAAEAWKLTGREALVRPISTATTGRRPGQAYGLFPLRREPDAEHRLGSQDLGIIARAS